MQVQATITFCFAGRPGENRSVGFANRSTLQLNGVDVEVDANGDFTVPMVEVGADFALLIPSGEFTGTVVSAADDEIIVVGRWAGREAGLLGGMSGFGSWESEIDPEATVISSVLSSTYREYREAKQMAEDWLVSQPDCDIARPQRIAALMRSFAWLVSQPDRSSIVAQRLSALAESFTWLAPVPPGTDAAGPSDAPGREENAMGAALADLDVALNAVRTALADLGGARATAYER